MISIDVDNFRPSFSGIHLTASKYAANERAGEADGTGDGKDGDGSRGWTRGREEHFEPISCAAAVGR